MAEAGVLRANGLYAGAVYLGGYAVECYLKAAICHTLGWDQLRGTFKTHDLESLMLHSGFDAELRGHPQLVEYFAKICETWALERADNVRYRCPTDDDEGTAKRFFEWVEDPDRGIVPWLRKMMLK